MNVTDIIGRRVGKWTEQFHRCSRLTWRHLTQHPRDIIADVDSRLSAVLDETVLLNTTDTHT